MEIVKVKYWIWVTMMKNVGVHKDIFRLDHRLGKYFEMLFASADKVFVRSCNINLFLVNRKIRLISFLCSRVINETNHFGLSLAPSSCVCVCVFLLDFQGSGTAVPLFSNS